jgi:Mg-chelatase subunit ChlD
VGALVLLGTLILSGREVARAQAPAVKKDAPRPHVDLILIVDTSESMVGKGKGATNIFGSVKQAAKELVDWAETGDSVVLISYDETVRLQPAVAVYGAREKAALKSSIDGLRAKGLFTYTAAVVRDALSEAVRLHNAQKADPGGPHTKFIVLITDGINEPPPYAGAAGKVSLPEVAKQLSDRPWFVWQIQLGPKVDRDVERVLTEANPGGYAQVEALQAKGLSKKLRDQVITEFDKRLRRSRVRLKPERINFGSLQAGSWGTQQISAVADPPGPTGRIRLRAETPAGAKVTISPEQLAIPADGTVQVQFVIEVGPEVASGQLSGVIVAEVAEGQLDLAHGIVTWSATVTPRTRTLRIEPAALSFATLRPGSRSSQNITLVADEGHTGGRVRLRPEGVTEGVRLSVEPEEVAISAGAKGQAKVTLEVGPQAPAGARSGRFIAQVTDGALELKTSSVSWSAVVEWPVVQVEPAALDFGRVRPGDHAVQTFKLTSSSADVSGKVRLQPEGVPAGVQLSVDPEQITIRPGIEAQAQVTVAVAPDTPAGELRGQLIAAVADGAVGLKSPIVAWSVTVPQSPVRLAAQIGGALVLLAAIGGGWLYWRRPRIHGTLRYWKQGQRSTQVDLEAYKKTQIRIGGSSGCEIQLAAAADKRAVIRATKQSGLVICVIKPEGDASIQHEGRAVSHLDLYDGDEFTFEGYTLAYKGEVPSRPRTRS